MGIDSYFKVPGPEIVFKTILLLFHLYQMIIEHSEEDIMVYHIKGCRKI